MKLYRLCRVQKLPISIEEAWDFFSNPGNLPLITPPSLGLRITSGLKDKMYPGMIITYVITPILGIPVDWVTEITHVSEPRFFVDEQRFGPYRFWHHKHLFREIETGVEIEDVVDYSLPFGPIGRIVNEMVVKRELKKIFDYRQYVLERMFGKDGFREKGTERAKSGL
jgi:ligand-binding SRPBCC domain-containing protein